jgi:hypothetical protein
MRNTVVEHIYIYIYIYTHAVEGGGFAFVVDVMNE